MLYFLSAPFVIQFDPSCWTRTLEWMLYCRGFHGVSNQLWFNICCSLSWNFTDISFCILFSFYILTSQLWILRYSIYPWIIQRDSSKLLIRVNWDMRCAVLLWMLVAGCLMLASYSYAYKIYVYFERSIKLLGPVPIHQGCPRSWCECPRLLLNACIIEAVSWNHKAWDSSLESSQFIWHNWKGCTISKFSFKFTYVDSWKFWFHLYLYLLIPMHVWWYSGLTRWFASFKLLLLMFHLNGQWESLWTASPL